MTPMNMCINLLDTETDGGDSVHLDLESIYGIFVIWKKWTGLK